MNNRPLSFPQLSDCKFQSSITQWMNYSGTMQVIHWIWWNSLLNEVATKSGHVAPRQNTLFLSLLPPPGLGFWSFWNPFKVRKLNWSFHLPPRSSCTLQAYEGPHVRSIRHLLPDYKAGDVILMLMQAVRPRMCSTCSHLQTVHPVLTDETLNTESWRYKNYICRWKASSQSQKKVFAAESGTYYMKEISLPKLRRRSYIYMAN